MRRFSAFLVVLALLIAFGCAPFVSFLERIDSAFLAKTWSEEEIEKFTVRSEAARAHDGAIEKGVSPGNASPVCEKR